MTGVVVVTGASGFIGHAVCRHLAAAGLAVRAVLRKPTDTESAATGAFVAGDLATAAEDTLAHAMRNACAVVHLAARAHVMDDRDPDPRARYMRDNVEATERVARAALAAGVERFVFTSTIKVNGEATTPGDPFTPASPLAPADDYARSKAEAERRLEVLCAGAGGPALVILRLPLVHGPQVRGNFLALLEAVAAERLLPVGAIDNRRSLLAVDHLAAAIAATLAPAPPLRGTFTLADTPPVSTPELVRAMARALDVEARIVAVPLPLLRVVARVVGRGAALDRLAGSLEVDSSAFRAATGWSPGGSLDDALRATVRWWRTRHAI